MGDYFDREGKQIDIHMFSTLLADDGYKRVAQNTLKGLNVSTVWLGLDHGFGNKELDPPIIFETMVFGGDHTEPQWRYATEDAALENHAKIVKAIQDDKYKELLYDAGFIC